MGEEVPLLHLLLTVKRLIRLTEAHKEFGLTKSQVIILAALHYRGSLSMSETAQFISSSREQATRSVAALCDEGILERFELPDNRTHVYIRFTENGEAFMRELWHKLRAELGERLETSLTPEEIETLRSSVQTTVELLRKVQ